MYSPSCDVRCKAASGELEQITSDAVLRAAIGNLEDGFRLTLWAYEKSEVRDGYRGRGLGREGGREESVILDMNSSL